MNFNFLIDSVSLIGFELTMELDSETFSFLRNGEISGCFLCFYILDAICYMTYAICYMLHAICDMLYAI